MTQYKFRGKRVENGQWVFGSLVKGYDATYIVYEAFDDDYKYGFDVVFIPVVPETVGMVSDLRDEDAKEICVGDILSIPEYYETPEMSNNPYIHWECVFEDGKFNLKRCSDGMIDEDISMHQEYEAYDGLFTIIGNKFDNPELIKHTA